MRRACRGAHVWVVAGVGLATLAVALAIGMRWIDLATEGFIRFSHAELRGPMLSILALSYLAFAATTLGAARRFRGGALSLVPYILGAVAADLTVQLLDRIL